MNGFVLLSPPHPTSAHHWTWDEATSEWVAHWTEEITDSAPNSGDSTMNQTDVNLSDALTTKIREEFAKHALSKMAIKEPQDTLETKIIEIVNTTLAQRIQSEFTDRGMPSSPQDIKINPASTPATRDYVKSYVQSYTEERLKQLQTSISGEILNVQRIPWITDKITEIVKEAMSSLNNVYVKPDAVQQMIEEALDCHEPSITTDQVDGLERLIDNAIDSALDGIQVDASDVTGLEYLIEEKLKEEFNTEEVERIAEKVFRRLLDGPWQEDEINTLFTSPPFQQRLTEWWDRKAKESWNSDWTEQEAEKFFGEKGISKVLNNLFENWLASRLNGPSSHTIDNAVRSSILRVIGGLIPVANPIDPKE